MRTVSINPIDALTGPSVPHRRAGSVWHGIGAAGITIALAALIVVIGFQLALHDDRSHIPGHWVYRSMIVVPSLFQFAYVLPIRRLLLSKGATVAARGMVVGAICAVAINAALIALVLWIGGGD